MLRRAWAPVLGIVLSVAPALAQQDLEQASTTAPGFSRIDVSPTAAIRFEGAGTSGDRIALHVDGLKTARANVDAQGQWRMGLEQSLPPGDHAAKAVSIAQGNGETEELEDARIATPDGHHPSQETDGAVDVGPPDRETLRRASELARDASRMFSEVMEKEQASVAQNDPAGERTGAGDGTRKPAGDVLSDWPYGSITAWLTRARHDYNEVLVKALSDPARWRHDGHGSLWAQNFPRASSPGTDWPAHDVDPAAGYLSVAAGWLHRSSRDYHEFLVRELILRGIEDEEQRELARAAMSRTTIAAAADAGFETEPPHTATKTGLQAEEQRLAEARRLEEERAAAERRDAEEHARQKQAEEVRASAEARAQAEEQERRRAEEDAREDQRLAEARRLADERSAAEERVRQKQAEEARAAAEAQAREQARAEEQRLAEVRRRELERQEERVREEQRLEEARQAFALDEYLAARPRDTRGTESEEPKRQSETWSEHAETSAQAADGRSDTPKFSEAPAAKPDPGTVAPVPTRIDVAKRERFMADIAAERGENRKKAEGAHVRRPARRALGAAKSTRRYAKATRAAKRNSSGTRKATRRHHARPRSHGKHARSRICRDRRAGRAIRPPGTYVIAYGDTLWSIAQRHYGAGHRYRRIRRADGRRIVQPHRIYPCQRVWLPRLKHRRR